MSDEMTRDELLALMRAWGWTLTGSLSDGRADLWTHPGGMDEVVLPSDETAPDYDRMLRQAESIIARAEGPWLLAVVREVAGLHVRIQDGIAGQGPRSTWRPTYGCEHCSTEDVRVPWPCPTARALQALTETTEETR